MIGAAICFCSASASGAVPTERGLLACISRGHPRRKCDGAQVTLSEHCGGSDGSQNESCVSAWKLQVSHSSRPAAVLLGKSWSAHSCSTFGVALGVASPHCFTLGGSGQWLRVASVGGGGASLLRLGVLLPSPVAPVPVGLGLFSWHPVLVAETTFPQFRSLVHNRNCRSNHEGAEPRAARWHSEQIVDRSGAAQQGVFVADHGPLCPEATRGFPVPLASAPISRPTPAAVGQCETLPSLSSRIRADLPELRAGTKAKQALHGDPGRRPAHRKDGYLLRQHIAPSSVPKAADARKAAGSDVIFPLQEQTVAGVAAALRTGVFKSAGSCA